MSMKILMLGCLAAAFACQPERNMNGGGAQVRDTAAAATAKGPIEPAGANTSTGSARENQNVRVLFFGTSLTAGYGLDPAQAFPNLIARQASKEGLPIEAVNAGLSGETSAGALRRIGWVLQRPADIVVLETGGNDALRALDADSLKSNLSAIVARIRQAQPQARILLAVMEAPPNLGSRYTATFRKAYSDVAKAEGLTLVPFLLDRVAGHPELNLPDGVHPNEKGERLVAENVWRALRPVVQEVYASRGKGLN